MFDYVKGILAEKSVGGAVVETAGVGYELSIPLSTFEALSAEGSQVKLFTHHYVREDAEKLYGFSSKAEREIFRQLIAISNIGPKTAISILSGVSPQELVACVNRGDTTRLRKIPGVGDKTASRLVMELKGRLGAAAVAAPQPGIDGGSVDKGAGERGQAFDAMVSLGYTDKQVQAALSRVESVIEPGAPVEEWIKKALQVI
ncbi:MAG TPA: Holliday junction branch migration protein RuvA [Chitinivibrionales bacterium]|jgi:Holliday junction DNA helicase RuvA|nr:Holliday junction branch migration protein RuvA [Chitinivibrionales bacterium]